MTVADKLTFDYAYPVRTQKGIDMTEIELEIKRHMATGNSFTRTYTRQLKEALGIESDYALAKHLQVSKTTVSNYTNGHTFFSEAVCFRVAQILNMNPAIVISAIEVDRRSGHGQKSIDTWAYIHRITRQMQAGFANVKMLALLAIFSIAASALPAWAALYFASFSARVVCILCKVICGVTFSRMTLFVKLCKAGRYVPRHTHSAAFLPAR